MKLNKNIILGFLVLIIVLVLFAYILPSRIYIKKSSTIKVKKVIVFDQINNLQNWEKWSPWFKIDTSIELKYYGNEKGEGAGFEWKSDHNRIGNGSLTILASKPYDSIYAEIDFQEGGKGQVLYYFDDLDSATKLTWIFQLNLGNNPLSRYMGLFTKKCIGLDLQLGLDSIKKISENISSASQKRIKESSFQPFTYIGIRDTVKFSELNQKMKLYFKELMTFVDKYKIKTIGVPFSIYYSFSIDKVDFETGIPVESCKASTNKIKVKQMKTSKVIVADYYGPYSGLGKEYEVILKWIVENKKKVNGAPIEMYLTDPMKEKDTSKWLTKIFYPIE